MTPNLFLQNIKGDLKEIIGMISGGLRWEAEGLGMLVLFYSEDLDIWTLYFDKHEDYTVLTTKDVVGILRKQADQIAKTGVFLKEEDSILQVAYDSELLV